MQEQVRQILSIYCLCDDFLCAWGHKDAPQAKMTTAQVMTVALVAVTLFNGNQERSRCFLKEHGYIPKMLSKGAFNRRLHEVPEAVWQALFKLLADVHKQINERQEYAVDSLPVPVCDNIRIRRCRLYPCPKKDNKDKTTKDKTTKDKTTREPNKAAPKGEGFRGYIASKKRYFYGLKVHLLVTTTGLPVEVMLAPGSEADISAFKCLPLDLPGQAHIFADAGYLDAHEQSLLEEAAALHLVAARRSNCKEQLLPWVSYISKHERKRVETVFSQIVSAFGRTIHAVTPRGFELKVFLTVLAYTLTA